MNLTISPSPTPSASTAISILVTTTARRSRSSADGALEPEGPVRPDADGVLRPVHDVGLPAVFAPYVRLVRPVAEAVLATVPAGWLARMRPTPSTLYRHQLGAAMIAFTAALAVGLARLCRSVFGSSRKRLLSRCSSHSHRQS